MLNGGAESSKADLERFVVKHGGRNVQAYRGKGRTHFALAASAEDFRAQNLVAHARADLLRPSFLFDCEVAGRVLTPQPRHLLVSGDEATRERLEREFDALGDAYFEETTAENLEGEESPRVLALPALASLVLALFLVRPLVGDHLVLLGLAGVALVVREMFLTECLFVPIVVPEGALAPPLPAVD